MMYTPYVQVHRHQWALWLIKFVIGHSVIQFHRNKEALSEEASEEVSYEYYGMKQTSTMRTTYIYYAPS